ncbi:DNA polymerase III subunit gamma/tau [Moraxella pluranimalium]|uniref:DNA polymerase III subunit gamma/tau n=1 Tax=Moraxella pluranimalium TaxID=470453 RepID=A0A1T0CQC7_9GAMM|nr:DNA polymerase III subunit gamma/tau [Moraxella pluranimalium]OOS24560.1 DNA polymerase III subunit gamma/tau [Moraxella pluranimalium]
MDKQYQVLARKYRPKNFSELLGQTHVSQALANAIDTGRLHHAYLFTGTRGVGKTTIARILAKCLNCETGITSTPCGICDTCQSIDAGRFLDLIEIDAASRTKVEDTRDLLENVPYAPVQGRYKVYLIDEVHMLSTHSFNALLKTLEEPPEHVKFIFATTDPQKLPITIISRCLQFVLRPMPQALLAEHLAKVLSQESVVYSESALWQLASAAKGSVRDALSLTDQAIAFGGGAIQADTVNEMLGLVNSTDVLALIAAIYQDDKSAVSTQIALMREKMVDAASVFDELIDRIHQMALLQVLPQSPLDMSEEEQALLTTLSQQISADVLQLYYEILIKSRDGIRLASTPMQALEMGILRLLAFRPLAVGEVVVSEPMPSTSQAKPSQVDEQGADIQHSSVDDTVDHSEQDTVAIHTDTPDAIDQHTQADMADTSDIEPSASDIDMADMPVVDEPSDSAVPDVSVLDMQDIPQSDTVQDEPQDTPEITDDILAQAQAQTDTVIAPDDKSAHEPEPIEQTQETADTTNADLDVSTAQHEPNATSAPNEPINPPSTHDTPDVLADTQQTSDAPSTEVATYMTKQAMQARLLPQAVTLSGEWTPQKWDYWLSQARLEQAFDADELALLSQSIMTGDIDGDSQLIVSSETAQVNISFEHAYQKFAIHYPNIRLNQQIKTDDSLCQASPSNLLSQRQQQIQLDAQTQLINSPVLQRLWQSGFIVNDGNSVLLNSKLSLE